MRKDVMVFRGDVLCRNADTTGFGKQYAKTGDFIIFNEGTGTRCGRVHSKVRLPEHESVYLNVLAISEDHTFLGTRYVWPPDVIRIVENPGKLMQWFFSDWPHSKPFVKDVRLAEKLAEYGTLSEHYVHNLKTQISRLAEEYANENH